MALGLDPDLIFLLAAVVLLLFVFSAIESRSKARSESFEPEQSPFETSTETQQSRAVVLLQKSGPYTLVNDWERPRISANEVLVRNKAIGLNPIDWKCVTYGFGVYHHPWISGREASGVIEEIGPDVKGFQKGDRVWVASTNYRDNRTSTFQEFLLAQPHNIGKLPDWISFEEGATLGVGSIAAAAALYDGLGLTWPPVTIAKLTLQAGDDDNRPWILVWGASSVTGMMATQLSRLSGLRVFAVAGLQNKAELLSIGASVVADRHEPEAVIHEASKHDIKLAIDCVGQETATYAVRAMKPGGRLAYLVKKPKDDVVSEQGVSVTDILIKKYHEDERYGGVLSRFISESLAQKVIGPVRHEVIHGGLGAVETGLAKLKSGEVSCRKLVVAV